MRRRSPPSWPPPHGWQVSGGAEDWQRFGRRIAGGIALVVAILALTLVATGALLAMLLIGTGDVDPRIIAGLVPALVLVGTMVAGRSVVRSWRPVRDLMRAAAALAEGDYSTRVTPSGSRASRRVAASFNEMARRLEAADEQRRRLLADLGHELRTPLAVVQGEIEAMIDGVHEPDAEQLALLLDEVAVIERLLEDLRTLSLAESGALTLHVEPTDLAALVADVADAHRRSAEAAGVSVRVDAQSSGEDAHVDPVRIREVLTNLVVNALRAMPDGGSLGLRMAYRQGETVVEVSDTGIGIAPDDVEAVFERFRKGETSTGSGLGLTISRDLVEAHGGTLTIESVPGEGTTARMTIPIAAPPSG